MIFKCNSKRICKHLWSFILDQKAFFNFKRGADVPKIKSSSSFFLHKSKFRFSGRCESELISSQQHNRDEDMSIMSGSNLSPLSNASMLEMRNIINNNNSISNCNNTSYSNNKYSTLQHPFKR
jgi:hypothetical protein